MKNVENIRGIKIFIILFILILSSIFKIIFLKRINYFQPYIFNCHKGKIKTLFFKGKIQTNNYFFKNGNSITSLSNVENYRYYTQTPKEFREKILRELHLNERKGLEIQNLYISPYSFTSKFLFSLKNHIINKYQKINRFFGFEEYVSKSLLYLNYKKMKELFPNEYNYMLETYSYPEDKDIIYNKFKNFSIKDISKDNYWLIKPKLSSVGNGIKILNSFENIEKLDKNSYITKLLNNPHLIRGYKYDIRFHGLISSIKPLKLYIYDEGFVRLSSEKYDFNNFTDKLSFITNIHANKNNIKYIYPKKHKDIERSNLWNLSILKNYYLKNNLNYNMVFEEVKDIFIKMVFSVRKKLIEKIININLSFTNFYHLIGFDIILDNNLKPYLLEANRRGSMRDDNAAEIEYTHNIIVDTLNIIGLRPINKGFNDKNYENEDNICELERPRGMYNLIFPLKNNIEKYKKYYLNDIPFEDLELWKVLK
jgi:hypothetical protein